MVGAMANRRREREMDNIDGAIDMLIDDLGDEAIAVSIVERFLAELELRLTALDEASSGGDLVVMRRIGHQLKSSSALLGLGLLRDRSVALEAAESFDAATDVVALVREAAQEARVRLSEWLSARG